MPHDEPLTGSARNCAASTDAEHDRAAPTGAARPADVPLDVRTLPHAQRHAPRRAASPGARDTAPEAPRPPLDPPLDVRPLPPARRHERIFETYAALGVDQAFVLINDHDPKPLYYQFAAEQAGRFAWEPLESGPEVWRVRIAKRAPT